MYDAVLDSEGKRLSVLIKCNDLAVRVIFPKGLGDGAADQPQTDKSDFGRSHDKLNSFHKIMVGDDTSHAHRDILALYIVKVNEK